MNVLEKIMQIEIIIYGVDLMPDNISECKTRLLELIPPQEKAKAEIILNTNIVCADSLTWDFINWKGPKTQKSFF